MNIQEAFSKQNIIENLANYEMYYQISIGNLIAMTQTNQISPEIELQYALGSIYDLLRDLQNYNQEEIDFQNELKKQSAMDALQNVVNENLELVKSGQIEVESIVNSINDNEFFNEAMNNICKENQKTQLAKWSEIITDELAQAIMQSLLDLESQQN